MFKIFFTSDFPSLEIGFKYTCAFAQNSLQWISLYASCLYDKNKLFNEESVIYWESIE